MWKKSLSVIAILTSVILFVCGCSSIDSGQDNPAEQVPGSQAAVADARETDMNYASIMNMQVISNVTYYYTYQKDEETDLFQLECCRQEGESSAEVVHTYGDSVVMRGSRVDAQGCWYNLYEEAEAEEGKLFLQKLDTWGEALFLSQIEVYEDTLLQEEVFDTAVTGNGEFCVLTDRGTLLFWDEQGREQGKLVHGDGSSLNRWESGLVNAQDAGIYLYQCENNTVKISEVNCASASLGSSQKITVPADQKTGDLVFSDTASWVKVYSGYQNGIYLAGADKLWKYLPETGELTELLTWSDPYVNLNVDFVEQIYEEAGKIVFLCYDIFQNTSSRVVVEQKDVSQLPEKKAVVLGAVNDFISRDNLEPLIQKYNEQSDRYYVELKLYGSEDGKLSEAIEEMNLDLLQGKGPDLFELSRHSIPNLIDKGVLEDLRPYFAASSRIKEEELVSSVVHALESENGLYAMTPTFSVRCLVSLKGYSTDGAMSTRQCMDLVEDHPEAVLKTRFSRYSMFDLLLTADIDRFVNWQEGTCSFDNEDFIQMLSTVSKWKEDVASMDLYSAIKDAESLHEEKSLLTMANISSMVSYLQIKSAFEGFADISGWPNRDGKAKYLLNYGNLFGIGAGSGNKEGAWDFIEYLLSEEHQESLLDRSLPVVGRFFEEALTKGMAKEGIYQNSYTGEADKGLQPTPQDQEAVRTIVENIYYDQLRTDVISDILREETAPVFEDSKTAQEAAKIIQGRVGILLGE